LADAHGQIMVMGFLGTLIALERAQALRRTWAYLAPALLGAGGIALAAGATALGELLQLEGAVMFLVVYLFLHRRAPLPLVAVQALSVVLLLAAALLVPSTAPATVLPLNEPSLRSWPWAEGRSRFSRQ
jgi:4-hydroxybenzoate polyprenyltransferase